MDAGYPTSEELQTLTLWPASDFLGPLEYMLDRWRWEDHISNTDDTYFVHTGGWSGHEEMLDALEKNFGWWKKHWYSIMRGGLYVFKKQANF